MAILQIVSNSIVITRRIEAFLSTRILGSIAVGAALLAVGAALLVVALLAVVATLLLVAALLLLLVAALLLVRRATRVVGIANTTWSCDADTLARDNRWTILQKPSLGRS
jgi:membrane-bound ClpP family serine protease